MLTELEIRAVAQRIVDKSKETSRVDTGALKRSISFSYVKEVVIFRQIYYGMYYENSKLEKNAIQLMPYGVQWKIIYTKFGGGIVDVGRTRSGRRSQKSTVSALSRVTSRGIVELIKKAASKKKAAAEEVVKQQLK